ncbi:glycosyltransferase [Geobacter sp.]|uniref:glycosyltransferase n=1 Tax=Geobacter sp. TaxID=46610 RepID=UPI00260A56B8|nr:glycosyltransferase [Geobacter sp.]
MDISVIICTFSRQGYLYKVLLDLLSQESVSQISYEVLVVDNNSTDNTKGVCEEFTTKYPDVFRYVFEERQGKTFALNTGIRESRGRIVAFTDDDVVIDKRWLFSINQAFVVHRDCKAFGGRVLPLWPDTLPPWIAKEGVFRNTSGAIVEHDYGNMVKSYSPGMFPIGANMFFSREIFEKYGWFNEALNMKIKKLPMLEDMEFCNRLLKRKENFLYIPDSVVYHPIYQDRLSKNYIRKHAFKSGRAQYIINANLNSKQLVLLSIQKNRRKILNIPFYVINEIAGSLVKYILAKINNNKQEVLYYEKRIIYNLGIVYEILSQIKSK